MSTLIKFFSLFTIVILMYGCKKDAEPLPIHYYEVGFKASVTDWRDSLFIIAIADTSIVSQIEAQLTLPVSQRKMVKGPLVNGSGAYNKNAAYEFKWHFKEDQVTFADISAEIYDGRPYSDVDSNFDYWLNTMKFFGPWNSYVKKQITP
jgi:hypothetical protein